MKRTFSSYEEISKELEILKIEKEIGFLRLTQSTTAFTNNFTATNLLKFGLSNLGNSIGNSNQFKAFIFSTVLKFFIRKLFKRK